MSGMDPNEGKARLDSTHPAFHNQPINPGSRPASGSSFPGNLSLRDAGMIYSPAGCAQRAAAGPGLTWCPPSLSLSPQISIFQFSSASIFNQAQGNETIQAEPAGLWLPLSGKVITAISGRPRQQPPGLPRPRLLLLPPKSQPLLGVLSTRSGRLQDAGLHR